MRFERKWVGGEERKGEGEGRGGRQDIYLAGRLCYFRNRFLPRKRCGVAGFCRGMVVKDKCVMRGSQSVFLWHPALIVLRSDLILRRSSVATISFKPSRSRIQMSCPISKPGGSL